MRNNALVELRAVAAQPQQGEGDWDELALVVQEAFCPHAPIDALPFFAGRESVIDKILGTVRQKGRHAIVFGERGVGKTSLANIVRERIAAQGQPTKIIKRNCTRGHDFRLMWVHALDDYLVDGLDSETFLKPDLNAYDIYKFLDALPKDERQVIIFDEFDRIGDRESVCERMADTIKYLADYPTNATIIVIGVADSVSELFSGHSSIHRNVQQIKLARMEASDLRAIFETRLPSLGLAIDEKVKDIIIDISQGLPSYTHLLGQGTCIAAIERRDRQANLDDLAVAITKCVEEADEAVRDAYLRAVKSKKQGQVHREALLACAKAKTDEKGAFCPAAIGEPLANYTRQLRDFCEESRGPVLLRDGKPKAYEYRFVNPLLRPYVILKGIADLLEA